MMNCIFPVLIGGLSGLLINVSVEYFCHKINSGKNAISLRKIFWKSLQSSWSFGFTIIITIVVTVAIQHRFTDVVNLVLAGVFSYSLLLLTFVDIREQILPDIITKPLIVAGVIVGWFGTFTDFYDSLLGAFLGYFVFWLINYLFKKIRKKEGMGYGDFKLLSAIGAWIGASQIPLVIMLSSVFGIIVALLTHNVTAKGFMSKQIPFGPSLALAGFLAMCYGEQITHAYLSLFYL